MHADVNLFIDGDLNDRGLLTGSHVPRSARMFQVVDFSQYVLFLDQDGIALSTGSRCGKSVPLIDRAMIAGRGAAGTI